jgi:hypothetical protein
MARTLDVYIGDDIAGQLVQDDGGQMSFRYAEAWLNKPEAVPLSIPAAASGTPQDQGMPRAQCSHGSGWMPRRPDVAPRWKVWLHDCEGRRRS